ncbi:MAG: DUF423 domain-containing protein [Bacteroidota bacterium]
MSKKILLTASLSGALAVIIGAFGAHGLKNLVDAYSLSIWAKGVEYQFYHTFALLFLSQLKPAKYVNLAYWFFTFGMLLFSGSLYVLATRTLSGLSIANFAGPVTPIGGLLLILGWLMLFLSTLNNKNA